MLYVHINTKIFSYLCAYFYIWVYVLIACSSVQSIKEIYLHGSCLLETSLFFSFGFSKKRKLIGFLAIINSQRLQQTLPTDIFIEGKKLCIPNQDNKEALTCLAFLCNIIFHHFS